MLETKLSRMESLLEVQLEKLSENMSSKNFKDNIAKDQVLRKIDSVYERINHKLGYIEGKFDMDVLKLQVRQMGLYIFTIPFIFEFILNLITIPAFC